MLHGSPVSLLTNGDVEAGEQGCPLYLPQHNSASQKGINKTQEEIMIKCHIPIGTGTPVCEGKNVKKMSFLTQSLLTSPNIVICKIWNIISLVSSLTSYSLKRALVYILNTHHVIYIWFTPPLWSTASNACLLKYILPALQFSLTVSHTLYKIWPYTWQ